MLAAEVAGPAESERVVFHPLQQKQPPALQTNNIIDTTSAICLGEGGWLMGMAGHLLIPTQSEWNRVQEERGGELEKWLI